MKRCFLPFLWLLALPVYADLDRGLACHKSGDSDCALSEFRAEADKGNARAQFLLGVMYSMVGSGVKQDYIEAIKWFRLAADQKYADAQYELGKMYFNGDGVKQDYAETVKWHRLAADQGHAKAQLLLGSMYDNGRGVKQNSAEALKWYRLAADQGDSDAQFVLGLRYEFGQGVKQDDTEALKWYRLAADQGDAESQRRVGQLIERSNCSKQATTKLFGVALKCASRDDLRLAVKDAGATVKVEDKNKWGDSYFSETVLKGSSELNITFTVDDFFAKAAYTFPSRMNAGQIIEIKDFVSNKYGAPDATYGNTSVGDASFEWRLDDGIEITVSRGWPDTTTYLSFVHPKNHQAMLDEQERQKKERQAKEYEKQNNAF